MRTLLPALSWLALAAAVAAQDQAELDRQRSAWSRRRSVEPVPEAAPLASLRLPPELLARCQPGAADLRLVDAGGVEVPYLLDRAVPRQVEARFAGTLVDTRREARRFSRWTADLGERRGFDTILVGVAGREFAKAVRAELSDDGIRWRAAADDAGIFERSWGDGRQRHTRIEVRPSREARFVRLTADDTRSPPIEVTGIEVASGRALAPGAWSEPAGLERLASRQGFSRYRLSATPGLPFERMELDAAAAAFSREARLLERPATPGAAERVLGQAVLYRVRVSDTALAAESLVLAVQPPAGGELVLELKDEDSPPLRGLRATLSAPETRLLFAPAPGALTLYYGNPVTRAARYDLEAQRARLVAGGAFAPVQLGPETANPLFRPPPPLAFTPSRAAPLEPRRFSHQRRFVVTGGEDLRSLTLAAADLAVLREDRADLRVVDAADVQLPFVLDAGAASERVPLAVGGRVAGAAAPPRATVARYALRVPGEQPLPLAALEIQVAERFFSRPVRLLDTGTLGRRDPRVVAAATLVRSGSEQPDPPPLELRLDGGRQRGLTLEVEEGDNAPWTALRVEAVVRLPRLVFKAGAGEYRVLLGDAEAAPPRYDIAPLAQEFLTYSALPVAAGALEPNLRHRQSALESLRRLPGTLLLWGTLAAAVVALLLLTARTLRQPPQP